MNAFGRRLFILWGAMAALLAPGGAGAGVALQPGTTLEFATVQQGREALGHRDEFVQTTSQFDRRVRMKTDAAVTEAQFLTFVQNQVQTWSAAEQTRFSNIVATLQAPLTGLNVSLPSTVWLIKTTGREEANAAYCRSNTIILPQTMVSGGSVALRNTLTHELFHIHSSHRPDLRPALYGVLGFQSCPEVMLPQSLRDLKITNPDAVHHDFFIRVKLGEERLPVVPVLYSKSATYTGGELFSYLISKLLVLEDTERGLRPRLTESGQPMLLDLGDVSDFYEQIGLNTLYNIHPEETLAENFAQLVLGTQDAVSPRIHHLLRRVFKSGTSACFPAGRFMGHLRLPGGQPTILETSTDLLTWQLSDSFTNSADRFEVSDPTTWLGGKRFFRARAGAIPPFEMGGTNNLVWIPPGTFLMGSPANESGRQVHEGPQHPVTLSRGFWLGRFEVTQSEYQQVMGTNPSSIAGFGRRPAENMTWAEATNYCARLVQVEQTAGRLPQGYTYRLPTEAEWEYAARAGTSSRYSFGDDPDYLECYERLWFFDNAGCRTHPAGVKAANPWGLHDMHGNVLEYCQDWYGAYSSVAVTDPRGPASGTRRVVRGGGWQYYGPGECRSASRSNIPPMGHSPGIGFRVVLAPATP